jgi:hypothetical protein
MQTSQASIDLLGAQTLQIALDLTARIRDAQRSDTVEYPIDLIKLLGSVVKVADDVNGLSLDAAIRRVTNAGYEISAMAPMGDQGVSGQMAED